VAETSPDANELWQNVLAKVPAQKAFVRNSAAAAHVLGIEGRNFQLGFAPGDKAMMDILGTQANRRFLETLLHEITGTDWSVKLSVKEELPSKQELPSEDSRSEKFKEDPLIQEAIGLFNAQIKS
jgi:DNA polymerase III gamma and tau subunits C terminal.